MLRCPRQMKQDRRAPLGELPIPRSILVWGEFVFGNTSLLPGRGVRQYATPRETRCLELRSRSSTGLLLLPSATRFAPVHALQPPPTRSSVHSRHSGLENMKRSRSASSSPQRVVIDVGGTKLTTTTDTIKRSSFLSGMVDLEAFAADAGHNAEIFLDRDPEIFACLLRLMRQSPHIAGLVPRDPLLCASVIAEADFLGFDALLEHVKVGAYYNSRDPKDDYPPFEDLARADGEAWPAWYDRNHAARTQHMKQCEEIVSLFESKDEAHALAKFDAVYGDIGAALRSGALPNYFLEQKPPKPKPVKKIVQVMPTGSPTWFLVGNVDDPKYGYKADFVAMAKMESVVAQPACVRRVACQALVEDERGNRWLEPMVNLSAKDLQELMNDGSQGHEAGLIYGVNISQDTALKSITGGQARRTMLASDWLEAASDFDEHLRASQLWSHLLVADTPPREFGFDDYES